MRVRASPVWKQTGLLEILWHPRLYSIEQAIWTGDLISEENGSFVASVWRFELLVARVSLKVGEIACGVEKVFEHA